MSNKRYTNMKIFLVILIVLAVVLFLIQNIGMPFLEQETTTQYYVAKTDIQPYTSITPDLFDAVEVDIDAVPSGFITNLDTAAGMYTSKYIYAGEYLTDSLLTVSNEEDDCVYTIEITSDYSGPLEYDGYVDIYLLSKDGIVTELFKSKRLYSASISTLEDGSTETVATKYIKVTTAEMMQYYTNLNSYSIIILPIADAYVGITDDVTTPTVDNSTNDTTQDTTVETFEWVAEADDTWESLASDWDIDEDLLRELNPSIDEITEGVVVNIPEEVN